MSRTGIRNIITEEIADGNDTANEGDVRLLLLIRRIIIQ